MMNKKNMKAKENTVHDGVTAKIGKNQGKMKKVVLAICAFLVLCALYNAACGETADHTGQAKTPASSASLKGTNYIEVTKKFENNGFTNISYEKIDDLVFGWLTKDGDVESVSVGGDVEYSSYEWVDADTEVVITYHTFPEVTPTQIPTDTPVPTQKATPTVTPVPTKTHTPTPTSVPIVYTVDNCEDLKAVLESKNNNDHINFANKYIGQIVEFDASIDYWCYHDNYTTRYDFLLSAEDYSEETQSGPTFKINNKAFFDLGTDLEEIYVGLNVHIKAKIESVNKDTAVIIINPISLSGR